MSKASSSPGAPPFGEALVSATAAMFDRAAVIHSQIAVPLAAASGTPVGWGNAPLAGAGVSGDASAARLAAVAAGLDRALKAGEAASAELATLQGNVAAMEGARVEMGLA